MHPAPDQQVMNDAYDHALWLRRCQSPLDQRDRMLCDLGHYVTQLLAALEKGQENCDAVYDDLREDNVKLRAAAEEANTQLWHAIEAGAYRGKPLQVALERARSCVIDALKIR